MLVHQGAGAFGVAGAGGFDESVVLLRRATGVVRALIQHGDDGAARGQFAQHARQHGIAHGFRQQDVEMAQQAVARLHVAAVQRFALFGQVGVDTAEIRGLGVRDELAGQCGFQDAAHRVDLAGLVRIGLAHEGALVGHDVDQLVLGQHQQGCADLGAADLVDLRQGLFAQTGAGRELVRHDGGGHFLGNVVGAGVSLNFLSHGARQRLPGGKTIGQPVYQKRDGEGRHFLHTKFACMPARAFPACLRACAPATSPSAPGIRSVPFPSRKWPGPRPCSPRYCDRRATG
ncbi:hypothetical protein D3C87_993160 [compost metagenome]